MAKFKVGDKVRAKDPAWPGYQGHALGHDVYVVKKVDWDGTVKLDGFIDVWVSPGSLISANAEAARNADTPEGRRIIERAKGRFAAIKDPGQLANVRDDILRGISRSSAIPDDKKDALEGEVIYLHEQALRKLGFNAVRSRNAVVQKALNAVAKNVSDGAKAMRRPLNAKFKVGDKVVVKGIGKTVIKTVDEIKSVVGPKNKYGVDIGGGKIMVVPEKDVSANACRNVVARNDKWIDDFHVIVTAGNPDPALLEALKKKAAAWKATKRNFSDKAAADAHDKATDDAMAIAKRLGARWIQQGAVTRVVMPNADTSVLRETAVNGSSSPWGFFVGEQVVIKKDPSKKKYRIKEIIGGDIVLEGVGPRFDASELDTANYAGPYRSTNAVVAKALNANGDKAKQPWRNEKGRVALNWNYKNKYQFFCVDPSMKAPCILSGWDYREDAKDDAAELKEFGIPHKIVSRRFLEQQGIDPNDGASWKKNRG